MRVLVDEGLPVNLRHHLPGHEVHYDPCHSWPGLQYSDATPICTTSSIRTASRTKKPSP